MTQLTSSSVAGGLAVEHDRIIDIDGTVIAESFQTRPSAGR